MPNKLPRTQRNWNYIRPRTKTSVGVSPLIKPGTDELTQSGKEQVEVLAEYFTSVFTKEPGDNIPTLGAEKSNTCSRKRKSHKKS